jgi:HEAT repeat protein/cytochrome c biogenesis protein CcdA/thioredoxin-related protein
MNIKKIITTLFSAFLLTSQIFAISTENLNEKKSLPEKTLFKKKGNKLPELVWYDNLDTAMAKASMEYRPILIKFESPNCPWCHKLDDEVFSVPDLITLLKEMILVRIDITQDRTTPAMFQITSIPVVSFCAADGRELLRLNGFVKKEEMIKAVKSVLNKKITATKSSQLHILLKQLKENAVEESSWPDIMAALGKYPKSRKDILEMIRNLDPFPKKIFVTMLKDRRLAVRLGTLEILEELTGNDFDFDPWSRIYSTKNMKAVKEWQKWAEIKDTENSERFSVLTEERCNLLILQAICGDRRRELRALRRLREGGAITLTAVEKFLKNNPKISDGKRNKIKELQYSILIPESVGKDPVMLAHKLIFGKLDSRMQAIIELKKGTIALLPILLDLLNEKESIIRETAVDTLITIGGATALGPLSEHLKNEKDEDVIFAVLRGISEVKDKKSGEIFISFLGHPNEDLVIAALNGITATKSFITSDQLKKNLLDKRWRVRVAALNTVEKLSKIKLAPQVEKMLKDKDDFVRYKAVETLAKIDKEKAAAIFKKVFLEDDSLKGAIVAAYGKMKRKIPKSFIEGLKGKSEQILLSVVQGMDECGKEALPLAIYLSDNNLKDIKLFAIRFIAENGISEKPSVNNALLIKKIDSKDEDEALAVLHYFSPPEKEESYSYSTSDGLDDILISIEEGATDNDEQSSDELVSLFEAFEKEPVNKKSKKKTAASEKKSSANDIIDLFNSFEDKKTAKIAKKTVKKSVHRKKIKTSPGKRKSMNDIKDAVKRLFKRTKNEEVKFYAASILIFFGESSVLPYLRKNFSKQTIEMRSGILNLLEDCTKKEVLDIAFIALNDPEASIRRDAASIILSTKKGAYISKLLKYIEKPDSIFKPYNFYQYRFRDIFNSLSSKKAARKWAAHILQSKKTDPMMASLAILIYEKSWIRGDAKKVEKYTKSENQWLRRAAYHAMGQDRRLKSRFEAQIKNIIKDPSPKVRIVLPKIIQARTQSSYSTYWVHFYDGEHFFKEYYWGGASDSINRKISQKTEKALRKLMEDEDPTVQMEAAFALLNCRKSIDLNEFVSLLDSFPDREAIGTRVRVYLENNYRVLGPGFNVLLTFLNKDEMNDSDIKNIFTHFDVKKDKIRDLKFSFRKDLKVNAEAQFLKVEEVKQNSNIDSPENMRLVYFTKKGCLECARVNKELKKLKEIFPNLIIEKYNISKIDSMQLNEIYCERFGVPEKMRLVAPAVFAGKGFLVKLDVTMDKLIPLTAKSASVPLAEWHNVNKKDIRISENRIKERYKKTSIWIIILAGLLDGINPCAFATIIFFLSYLQITRKNPKEIIMVGCSFISAVFISYMALGMGLNEIIGRLYIFDIFRVWFNRIMIFAVFIIMVMSLYDTVMCLRGKMENMALQLPGFLKERIRKTIRTGAKNSKFIIAAFVVGCIISFLELACTGQVYLPTIGYMWQTGSDHTGAIFYLLIYNLMFIIPLVVIFIAAYMGMKSDKLTVIFKKHAAFVKFSTALLFLALLIFLIYSTPVF